ncbi:terminase small subunit [Muricomes intestini]|jgi:phage terminase small subunit|uniref:terminase small subunit n=1 Tax=Muricomes intestini TaxID=1796634 RepID=UPI002FE41B65
MTKKQKRFCDEYLIDLNATQAAIRAGYSKKTAKEQGARLLSNVNIRPYLDDQLDQIHNQKTADAQEVIEFLTATMRGEHKEETLRFAGEGHQTIDNIAVGEKDRLKAAELIGKRYGIFTDKIDLDMDAELNINIDYGSEEDDSG